MFSLLIEIWPCLMLAAALGVLAGWLVWGRDTNRIVAAYRSRLAKAKGSWESVEERLAQALAHGAALERERDGLHREWNQNQMVLHEKEEAWKQERRLLDETVRQLNQRLMVLESGVRTPSARPARQKGPQPVIDREPGSRGRGYRTPSRSSAALLWIST